MNFLHDIRNMNNLKNLQDFIAESPTAYNAARLIANIFDANGFSRLDEKKRWTIAPKQKYYVVRNDSAILAFRTGSMPIGDAGTRIVAAHLDSPALKIKHIAQRADGSLSMTVDVYGGPIISTWLDRPLALAGRISTMRNNTVIRSIIHVPDFAVVPNLAIHLNRDINNGCKYDTQTQLNPIPINGTTQAFAKLLGIPAKLFKLDIFMKADLFLTESQPPTLCGPSKDIINAPRLDNLASAYAAMRAITEDASTPFTAVTFFSDNEEIGSNTLQGADSGFMRDILMRITLATGGTPEDFHRAMAVSVMLSVDAAHAIHPNFPYKHDCDFAPFINSGIAIKRNTSFRYATTGESAADFIAFCRQHDIPFQWFTNRADIPCGSTIGPILSANLGIKTVDIGIPLLAMHSIRETAGMNDINTLQNALTIFLSEVTSQTTPGL